MCKTASIPEITLFCELNGIYTLTKWFKSAVNNPTQARLSKGLANMQFHFSPS